MISLPSALMRQFEERGPIDGPSVPTNAPYVLGIDLNRSESAWGVLCLCFLPERTAHQDAPGDRCIAGFRFGPCPEWVQNSTHATEAGVRELPQLPKTRHCLKGLASDASCHEETSRRELGCR